MFRNDYVRYYFYALFYVYEMTLDTLKNDGEQFRYKWILTV